MPAFLFRWLLAIAITLSFSFAFAEEEEPDANDIVAQARALNQAGKGAFALKLLTESVPAFEAKLHEKPDDAMITYFFARVQFELKRDEDAAKTIDRAIELKPANPAFRVFKGEMLFQKEQPEKAEAEFKKAVELAPKSAKYALEYSKFLTSAGRIEEALAQSRQAVELDPSFAPAVRVLAGLLGAVNKSDEALVVIERGVKQNPKDAGLRDLLGQVYQQSGKNQQAFDQFSEMARLDPTSIGAEVKLLQLATALENEEESKKHLARIYKLHEEGHATEDWFRREQFAVGKNPVLAMEHFELKGPTAVKYRFVVFDEKGKEMQYRVTLGSYDFTTEASRVSGSIKKDERMYHLDYYRGREHRTYGFFPVTPPTYEETRALFVKIAEGKQTPLSGSIRPEKEAKPEGKEEK